MYAKQDRIKGSKGANDDTYNNNYGRQGRVVIRK